MQYGISKCHYSIFKNGAYTAPKALLGAVSMSLAPIITVKQKSFLMGNTLVTGQKDDGYNITLDIFSLSIDFVCEVLGYTTENGLLIENQNNKVVKFKLLYETESMDKPIRHCIYNCTCQKPTFDVTTITETVSINPKKLTIIADYGCGLHINKKQQIKVSTTVLTPIEVYDNWFR
ncbi:MAG: hypothetical protein GX957_03630 [Clostridiaceae bacterium]|nr:hypothetical protein [Clostridiaceae bacterium]